MAGRAGADRADVAPVRRHRAVPRARPGDPLPTLRDPDLLVYYRQEGGAWSWAATSASARSADGDAASDAVPADFNGRLLEEDWDRFDGDRGELAVPGAGHGRRRRDQDDQRPEAFTPDNEFCLGETEVGGFFVAAGFCAHGIAGAGGIGKVMAEWIVEGEPADGPLAHGHPPLRPPLPLPVLHPGAVGENYETYYDIRYPGHERSAGRPLRVSARVRVARARTAPSSARRRAGSGSTTTGNEAGRRRRCARAGWAGRHWSPAIGAEHRGLREARGLFDETSFAKIEITGPGAAELLEWPVRQPGRPRGRRGDVHPGAQRPRRHRVRLHRYPAGATTSSSIVTGTAFGSHDRVAARAALPGTAPCGSPT